MDKGFVDYYSILGIDPTDDLTIIKKVYKRLAKITHPDVNGTGDDTEFKKIQEAYDILKRQDILTRYYKYYKKHEEEIRYQEFRKMYDSYIVKQKEAKKEEQPKQTKRPNKATKINVFFENFKKNNYVMRTAIVLWALSAVIITFNAVNKAKDESPKEVPLQQEVTEINEDILNYELIRNYEVEKGDTLYDLSIKTGTPVERIKEVNNLEDDTIYYNKTIKLPYEVQKADIEYYTSTVSVKNNSIYDLASKYSTTTETIYNLNREAIIRKNGTYYVMSDSLKMPNFIDKNELETIKNYENSKSLSK
ncbi:MAG: LysM peptidoglycan-binding domain-containing protein [Bacilli bacterium]|nr:LysM peptidoglycan-binding domain-containing protein [Bacilli bacterium]